MREQAGTYLAVIKVVGVGGGGSNAVTRMVESGLKGVEFLSVNTDAQALLMCDADVKLHIGAKVTRGLGAGADPKVGFEAAMESRDELKEASEGRRHGVRHGGRRRRHRHRCGSGDRRDRPRARRADGGRGHAAVHVRGPEAGRPVRAGDHRPSATRSTRSSSSRTTGSSRSSRSRRRSWMRSAWRTTSSGRVSRESPT